MILPRRSLCRSRAGWSARKTRRASPGSRTPPACATSGSRHRDSRRGRSPPSRRMMGSKSPISRSPATARRSRSCKVAMQSLPTVPRPISPRRPRRPSNACSCSRPQAAHQPWSAKAILRYSRATARGSPTFARAKSGCGTRHRARSGWRALPAKSRGSNGRPTTRACCSWRIGATIASSQSSTLPTHVCAISIRVWRMRPSRPFRPTARRSPISAISTRPPMPPPMAGPIGRSAASTSQPAARANYGPPPPARGAASTARAGATCIGRATVGCCSRGSKAAGSMSMRSTPKAALRVT